MQRDWTAAHEAHAGRGCRGIWHPLGRQATGHQCVGRLQLAHVSGRKYDAWAVTRLGVRLKRKVVHPLDVVPLCEILHDQYDGRRFPLLDVVPLLSVDELVRAVELLGFGRAMRRLQNTREWTVPDRIAYLEQVSAA